MRKTNTILLVLFLLLLIHQQCKKDELAPPLSMTAEISPVSGHGLADGAIDISVEGGVPPYKYHWSNDKTTQDLHELRAGMYSVAVTDAAESEIRDTFIVSQPPAETLRVNLRATFVSTPGGNDGSACAEVTGGVSPYEYHWSTGSGNPCITGLIAGLYAITVSDAEQTQVFDSIEIAEPGPAVLLIIPTLAHPSETGGSDGSIHIEVAGGYSPYIYAWSNGSEEKDLLNLSAGEYVLTVTDDHLQTAVNSIHLIDSVFDIDGNSYSIVKIGGQIWMQTNLRTTHAPDGSPLSHYSFDDSPEYLNTYGRLYSWNTAMKGSTEENAQGICPCGWHIPSDAEFQTLEIFLGMTPEEAAMENTWRGTSVGTKLKRGGDSRYDAPLAGRCLPPDSYSLQDNFEYVWTSSEFGENAWRRCLSKDSDLVGRWNTFPKTYGFSVRCMKNDE